MKKALATSKKMIIATDYQGGNETIIDAVKRLSISNDDIMVISPFKFAKVYEDKTYVVLNCYRA